VASGYLSRNFKFKLKCWGYLRSSSYRALLLSPAAKLAGLNLAPGGIRVRVEMSPTLHQILLLHFAAQCACSQIYAEPFYDPTFKLALRNEKVLAEFISVFTEIPHVTVIEYLDNFMNPLQATGQARHFVNNERFKHFMSTVRNLELDQINVQLSSLKLRKGTIQDRVHYPAANGPGDASIESLQEWEESKIGADFLYDCSRVFSDLSSYFPVPERNSHLDVLCRISGDAGDAMAMVEVQAVPQNFWDKRAVYYSSGVYFNQLRRGGAYENLRRVISIQLLGTSHMQSSPWKSTPKEYIRHYKFVDKNYGHELDQIELFQICVPQLKDFLEGVDVQRASLWKEWIEFLKYAHLQDAEHVKTVSPNLQTAYACLKLDTMAKNDLDRYFEEKNKFSCFSQFTSLTVEQAVNESEAKHLSSLKLSAVKLLPHHDNEFIASILNLDPATIAELRASAEMEAGNLGN
jgi:predicted transposase/invertase (TIGR01784 family)